MTKMTDLFDPEEFFDSFNESVERAQEQAIEIFYETIEKIKPSYLSNDRALALLNDQRWAGLFYPLYIMKIEVLDETPN